jgi:hypothetical protein
MTLDDGGLLQTESTGKEQVMPLEETMLRIPVVFHRWFENGAGWACDETLIAHLPEIVRETGPFMNGAEKGTCFERTLSIGHLIGIVEHDPKCPDTKAVARRPFILTAAVVSNDLAAKIETKGGKWQDLVVDGLIGFAVPTVRDENGRYSFQVPARRVSTFPENRVTAHADRHTETRIQQLEQGLVSLRNEVGRLQKEVLDLRSRERSAAQRSEGPWPPQSVLPGRPDGAQSPLPSRARLHGAEYGDRRSGILSRPWTWLVLGGIVLGVYAFLKVLL